MKAEKENKKVTEKANGSKKLKKKELTGKREQKIEIEDREESIQCKQNHQNIRNPTQKKTKAGKKLSQEPTKKKKLVNNREEKKKR